MPSTSSQFADLESRLRAAEEKARSLFEASRDGILRLDAAAGTVLEANSAIAGLLGCSAQDLAGKKLWQLCPESHSATQLALFKQLQASTNPTECHHLQFETYHKTTLNLPCTAQTFQEAGNKVIQCFIHLPQPLSTLQMQSENQAPYRQVLDHSPHAAYRRNMDTNRYDYFSPSIFQITGYTADELTQISIQQVGELIHPDDLDAARAAVLTARAGDPAAIYIEFRFLHKDGEYRWLSDIFTLTQDEHGRANFVFGNIRDITAEKNEKEDLRKTAEHYRTITENMKDVVWFLDAETLYFRYVSPSVERLRGFTPKEILAMPMDYALMPEAIQYLRNLIKERSEYFINHLGEPPQFYTEQVQQPCKDGSSVWTEVITTYSRNPESGRIEILGVTRDISDRKKAEEILQEGEERYHSLFDNMQEGVALHRMIYDENGRPLDYILEDLNPSYEKQVGITAAQAKGKLASLVYGTNPAPYLEIFNNVAQTGQAYFFETYFPPLDRHFEISVISTNKNGFATIFLDVSARKRAEEAIRLKDQLLHMTGSMAKVGGWEFDLQTRKYSWTDETARIFGLGPKTPMTEASIIDFYTEASRQSLAQARTEALSMAEPYDLELEMTDGTGLRKIVRVVGNPIVENGLVVKIQGIIQDVTEQADARMARRESERRYQQLFKLAPIPLCSMEYDGASLHINDRFTAVFGYTLKDITVVEDWWQRAYPDGEYRQQMLSRWNSAVQKANSENGEIEPSECYISCKDGTQRLVIISGAIIKNGLLVSFFDITELKQATQALEQQRTELARSNAELEQFAYVTSHDLQEPLRMISSYVQLLSRRYKGRLDGDADEFINYAVDGTVRMQRLINDLLSYSRVGTRGKVFTSVACEKILEQVLGNLRLSIQEKNASITHDPLPIIKADELQMGQLFQNLVGNALKFQGAEPPHIHISAESRAGEWIFSVEDNGIGIEPQYSDRIFVIFQRLHTRTEYPGTGIGLAICKKIVERHGGKIWVQSEPQKGSIFFFSIPI